MAQKQDLCVFSDQSVLSENTPKPELLLVSANGTTQPAWLINALVETCITGFPSSLNGSGRVFSKKQERLEKCSVTIASFIHDENSFSQALNKLKIASHSYRVVDFMPDLYVKYIQENSTPTDVISGILTDFPTVDSGSVILEQPEILLGLVNGLTAKVLISKLILPLLKSTPRLIIVTNSDSFSDLENENSHLSQELTNFSVSLFHMSTALLQLRPLATGSAKDVTGTLAIRRGGQPLTISSVQVMENDYLYLIQKDSTRLFYK